MLGEVVADHLLPPLGRPPRPGIQLAQVIPAPPREQFHPPEQGVADHRGEGAFVAGEWAGSGRHRHRCIQGLIGAGELLPLVEQAGVDLAHQFAEPLDEVGEFLGARGRRHPGAQRLERIGEVAQHRAFGAHQSVDADVLPERHRPFPHLAHHRLRRQLSVGGPRVGLQVHRVDVAKELLERLGVGDVVEQREPLLVLDALGLHLRDRLAAGLLQLRGQDLAGILDRRLDHRNYIQHKAFRRRIQGFDGGQGERRQRLVEGEIVRQIYREPVAAAVGLGLVEVLKHPGLQQRARDADRLADVGELAGPGFVVVGEQAAHRDERITGAVDDVEDHRRGDPHVRRQRLRGCLNQAGHGGRTPRHHALGDFAAHQLAALLGVVGDLGELLEVFHLMIGGLDDHGARGVEAGPPGPAGDLVELPRIEQPTANTVVLRQRREDDGANRHVDAHPESVGAADDFQQPGLGELLD